MLAYSSCLNCEYLQRVDPSPFRLHLAVKHSWDWQSYTPNPTGSGCDTSNEAITDGCKWSCTGTDKNGESVSKERCGDNADNDGDGLIDCFDTACQAHQASNTITNTNIENYNCLGTTFDGTAITGIPNDGKNYQTDYYCAQIETTESGIGEPVGLCCPSGEAPFFNLAYSEWGCRPSDPCLTPTGNCDYQYTSGTLLDWANDGIDCLNPSDIDYGGSSSACCAVISAGVNDYYSDSENVKIY